MKKFKMLAVYILISVFMVVGVDAAEILTKVDELETCLSLNDVVCTLGANIKAEDTLIASGSNVVLDLNGYTLSLDKDVYENAVLLVAHGAKLTIKDSSSEGTGKISYITDLTTKAVRTAIKMTKSGGDNTKTAELIVESGTLEGDSYAISGNGNPGRSNTKVTINGGNLWSKNTAIFQPQAGELIVNDGNIGIGGNEKCKTGIEVRSGRLTVNGGTIVGNDVPTEVEKNGNGTTTTGVGIAIVQHTTVHNIDVVINGGTIKGYTPFYQNSLENNSDSSKVALNIKDGNFVVINEGIDALFSGDKEKFVLGGNFSNEINKNYIADNLTIKQIGDAYQVGEEYTIKLNEVENGKVSVDKDRALEGEKVTITVTPSEGYELDTIKVVDAQGKEVSVTNGQFVLPNSNVKINVVFKNVAITTDLPVVDASTKVEKATVGIKNETETKTTILEALAKDEKLSKLVEGKSVEVGVEIERLDSKIVQEKVLEAMKEIAKKGTIAEFFDITIAVSDASGNIGTITDLTKEIELMVVLPEELKAAPKGMDRVYYILREHDGEVEKLEAKLSEDGKYLVFKSKQFSTYALAYEDVKVEEVPKTGDNVMMYVFLGLGSILLVGLTTNNLKKRATR